MNDSTLRDIIPSDNTESSKKIRQKQCSSICEVFIFTIFLGFISIGIVSLVLILAYSSRLLAILCIQSSTVHVLPLLNETRVLKYHQQIDSSEISNDHNLKKETFIPSSKNEPIQISAPTIKIEEKNENLSTSTQSMKSDRSSTIMIKKLSTSLYIQTETSYRESIISSPTTVKIEQYVGTSQDNRLMTDEFPISTSPTPEVLDHDHEMPPVHKSIYNHRQVKIRKRQY
ncbi:unnamed protein product [Rotaria magnacalcarata]|uniref:Uncharacterized protein n=1 Tax=Rotaria magnacalcarata TaxID=392030 RepID=A0A815UNS7_9BILA|nr:unnamed protein product [Rotaria magnacalcarata]CAF2151683.1 unnamed protein product [Rotaria magnacalcarata]